MAGIRLQGQYGRLELDAEFMGEYMRDAISRGGYRAALDYYERTKAATPQRLIHHLRARGWLLGRLALDDGVAGWMEEARACSEFDHMTGGSDNPRQDAESRAVARPNREVNRILRIEPADAAPPDPGNVPQWMWATMLVLDAVGPVYSRASLSAAVSVLGAKVGRKIYGHIRCDPAKYDPLDGKMRQVPRGHQRWIIGDVDTNMLPLNEPHYYYDLTDEGKNALEHIKADRAPWSKAAVCGAAELADMAAPDILEEACGLSRFSHMVDGVREDLEGLINAWDSRKVGGHMAPNNPRDTVLADLAPVPRFRDDIEMARLEHVFFIMGAVDAVHEIACSAKPASKASNQVLHVLIGKVQGQCRKLGKKISCAPQETRRGRAEDEGGVLYARMKRKWQMYAGELPASISDLYYCIAEYCKCRGLADDPLNRPLAESLTEREKAALANVLASGLSPDHEPAAARRRRSLPRRMCRTGLSPDHEPAAAPKTARPASAGRLSNGRNSC